MNKIRLLILNTPSTPQQTEYSRFKGGEKNPAQFSSHDWQEAG